jgi:hypothetical protein
MVGFIDKLYIQLLTTDGYSVIADLQIRVLQFTFLHTHQGSQSSLVVSWQRIFNSLTVTSNHTFFTHHWLYSPLFGPGLFFSFVIFIYTDNRAPWMIDQRVARPLLTHRTTQTQNKPNAHTDIYALIGSNHT